MSKQRQEVSCKGKKMFATRAEAKTSANKVRARNSIRRKDFSAYLCRFCGHYHIGNVRKLTGPVKDELYFE